MVVTCEKIQNQGRKDVQKPVRYRRDDMEPSWAALPGRVRHGGGEAGLGGDWPPI